MAKVVLLALVLLSGQMAESRGASPAAQTVPPYDQALEKYVQFLETQKQTPVDYIMGLYAKYDIVVLCERAHPETTQYDMILRAGERPAVPAAGRAYLHRMRQCPPAAGDGGTARERSSSPPSSRRRSSVPSTETSTSR